jgi:hypothetical protein
MGRYGANYPRGGDRHYKKQLPSITRLYLNVEYTMHKDLRLFLQLSNITNNIDPEFKIDFPAIGRGWMFGLKCGFRKTTDTGQ